MIFENVRNFGDFCELWQTKTKKKCHKNKVYMWVSESDCEDAGDHIENL